MADVMLDGVRILDLTFNRAGPSCTAMLAALGAEVIRTESFTRVDSNRMRVASLDKSVISWGTDKSDMEKGWTFSSINMGKLGIQLNLKSGGHREVIKRLVEVSDLVVEAFTPGVLEGFGIGYETLRQWKKDIILVSVNGFGKGGPHGHYRAYANIFAAAGGIEELTGYAGERPMGFVGRLDSVVGSFGGFGALAALMERERTGKGQHVDVSGAEAVTTLLGAPMVDHMINGRVAARDGNRRPDLAPHNCYPCTNPDEPSREEWVSIAVATNEEWLSLCIAIGKPELATDPRFGDLASRKVNEEDLDRILGDWTLGLGAHQAMQLLQAAGVSAMASLRADDLFQSEHLRERGAWVEYEHPVQGPRFDVRLPWIFSDGEGAYGPAPLFGQHNAYVYGELLGMLPEEILELQAQEVVY